MTLWLTLEGSAGSEISEVAADMAEVSKRLNLPVQVNANGIMMLCNPGDSKEEIEAQYHARMKRK